MTDSGETGLDKGVVPLITVVTPSLNQGRFLGQAIESVLGQEYPNLEFMVVDGGSSDESVEVLRSFEKQLAWWVSEEDRGQSDAINKGFRRANGSIMSWLNADDYLLEGALWAVAAAFEKRPTAPFYFGDGVRVNERGEVISGFFPDGRVAFSREAFAYGLNHVLQPASFINRKVAATEAILDQDLHYGMDSDLWLRLSALGSPEPVRQRLAASREYEDAKTWSAGFSRVEELRLIAKRHAGEEITPGVLCYFLDTLNRYCEKRPLIYSASFTEDVRKFWASAASLMDQFGARPDGFPK